MYIQPPQPSFKTFKTNLRMFCFLGGLIPKVAEIGTDARFSCKNSLNISTHEADLQGIEPSRLNIMTNQDVLLKKVGKYMRIESMGIC